ncbi:hypothetical protein ElyMa_000504000 [Elysia marginata]|uniref:Uncharacterized protein n=1 Tax=Elysia marginata TaxID=1093978 RepID=A0AAV4FVS2_9GAST|nr:hypothetical protein ElyMa_000504000 [Elysia marginata]
MITSTVDSGTHEHDEAYSEEAENFVPSSTNSDSSEHKSNSSVNHQEEIKLLKDKIQFYQQSQKRLQRKVKCLQAIKTTANDGKADIKVLSLHSPNLTSAERRMTYLDAILDVGDSLYGSWCRGGFKRLSLARDLNGQHTINAQT